MKGLEREIAKERAQGLGLTGKKLQRSIDRFNRAVRLRRAMADRESLLREIAWHAWALIVQREVIGFRHDNMRWVRDRFDIPDAAMQRLGAHGAREMSP